MRDPERLLEERRARHQPDAGEALAAAVVLGHGDEVGLAPAVAVEADVVRLPARVDVDEPAVLRGHLEERLEELLAGRGFLAPELELPAAEERRGHARCQARRRAWNASGITIVSKRLL